MTCVVHIMTLVVIGQAFFSGIVFHRASANGRMAWCGAGPQLVDTAASGLRYARSADRAIGSTSECGGGGKV
jgi:hypothetical protein